MRCRTGSCVCQLTSLLQLAASTVSKHCSILHQADLVESRKDGRWIYYRLADRDAPAEVTQAVALVSDSLANDPAIRDDARRLKQILKIDPEVLCRQHDKCR